MILKSIARSSRLGRLALNRARWTALQHRLPRTPDGRFLLHVGCGPVAAPGFVNLDARRMPHVHFVIHHVGDLGFVPERSCDLVYLSHVLEHVPHGQTLTVLRSFHRLLAPGGRCRLSVPDFDRLLAIYLDQGRDLKAILGPLMGGQDYPQNFHFTAFNAESLGAALRQAGFVDVRAWDPAQVDHHGFDDWSSGEVEVASQRYPVSLNLEAVRA